MVETVGVVGLGYVGLAVAVAFGRHFPTIGYELSRERIDHYERGRDPMGEVEPDAFAAARHLTLTSSPELLRQADVCIVTVPTPIDQAKKPDFDPLIRASRTIGTHLKRGATVVYESTVYPGATEEVCIPVLEQYSGLKWKLDFHVGYSPERINPGDREHSFTTITKVVAGDDPETLERVSRLYESVVTAGVHRASSIRVAEAAKVIENTQRDLNIALMNELSIIFNRLNLDTLEILEAAGTKWNFLPFRPGLVGGHCIGVDPFYLTHKADMVGYHPHVILAGRRINDGMGKFVAEQTVKLLIANDTHVKGAPVNVLGFSFKENCADLRNTRVIDIVRELESYGAEVHVHDPYANESEALSQYGVRLSSWEELPAAEAMIVAVAHEAYLTRPVPDLLAKLVPRGCVVDVKSALDRDALRETGARVWRL